MDQKLSSEQPGEFVINLQPRFYGLSYDNVTQFEASYTEEQLLQRAKRLKNQQRRRVRRLLLALIVVTVTVVVMIIVYSIIISSREYYGGTALRRNWWWSFFRRKLSSSATDKRTSMMTSGGDGVGRDGTSGSLGDEQLRSGSQTTAAAEHEQGSGEGTQKNAPTKAGGGEGHDADGGGGGGDDVDVDDDGTDRVGKTWLRACDNSKQGRTYVTDERGYVCRWDQMYSGAGFGCCWESDRTNISRYSCQMCDPQTSCCLEYEFCVSCCMNPIHEQRVDNPNDRTEVAQLSRFEQCLALCRTSSASILRQHVFISPSHFCYAAAAPPLG